MPSVHPFPTGAVPADRAALRDARLLLDRHGEALIEAPGLVAGAREAGRALALRTALGRAPRLTRSLRGELTRLHRLLGLELDPGHGLELAAGDPRAHGIRRLTDAVGDLLAGIAPHAPEPVVPAAAAPATAPAATPDARHSACARARAAGTRAVR